MVRVFRDAGYQVSREFEEGVLHLEFGIDPTEESLAVARSREQAAEARSVHNLLHPPSVAVIGASAEPGKVGHVAFVNLLAAAFTGTVYPVNPEHRSVRGVRAYPSVLDIPDPVDLALVAVPAEAVESVLDACLAKGVKTLLIVSGGFAESGPHGLHAELRLVGEARAHGMRVVGPNALGVLNTAPGVRLNATLAPRLPVRGRTGFFCQSGALGTAILADAERARPRPVDVRLGGQPRRRLGQRPAPVLGNRPGHRPRPAVPRVLRQPAQVRAAGQEARAHQAHRRGQVGAARGPAAAGGDVDGDRRGQRPSAVRARRGRAGGVAGAAVRHRARVRPPAPARRAASRHRRQLQRHRAAGRRHRADAGPAAGVGPGGRRPAGRAGRLRQGGRRSSRPPGTPTRWSSCSRRRWRSRARRTRALCGRPSSNWGSASRSSRRSSPSKASRTNSRC